MQIDYFVDIIHLGEGTMSHYHDFHSGLKDHQKTQKNSYTVAYDSCIYSEVVVVLIEVFCQQLEILSIGCEAILRKEKKMISRHIL